MDYSYQIIRSARKTIAIEIKADGQILVRCPQRMRPGDIQAFVRSKADWIGKHLPPKTAGDARKLTAGELARLREQTRTLVTGRAARFAPLIGVTCGRITVRAQHTRWGSCSSKGNLSFNSLLMLAPDDVIDYVVVHELCHRKQMNHSKAFWEEVARVFPDYETGRCWLREQGRKLIGRL